MKFMEKLLVGEKVEWKKLGEVANCFSGGTPKTSNSSFYDGEIPWIRSGEINFNVIKKSERNITKEGLEKSSAKMIKKNSVVLAMTGATVGRTAVVEIETSSNQSVAAIETNNRIINYKYLFYFLAKEYNNLKKLGQGALTSLNLSIIKNIKIPISSIETQEKIVEILDNFTKYVTELQAELQARNKQYNYYRDMLLSEDYLNKISKKLDSLNVENQELRLTTLGQVGKVLMCRRILKNQTTSNGEVPFYKIGTFGKKADSFISKSLFEEYKSRYSFPKKGDILISASGTIGRTVIYNGEDAYFQDSNIVWINNDETVVKNKYLYYFYSTNPWKISNDGTISRIYNKDIEKIKIFVPPIEIQNKIVKILDRFQELLSDTKGLLPLEIEQRRKQYEYYREKLLTFDKEEGYALSTAQHSTATNNE